MKLYTKKIGPVEYFDAMALVCFFFPYGWGAPKLWQACLIFTLGAVYCLHKLVKKEEEALRAARRSDPRIGKVVLAFGALMIANAVLIRVL